MYASPDKANNTLAENEVVKENNFLRRKDIDLFEIQRSIVDASMYKLDLEADIILTWMHTGRRI